MILWHRWSLVVLGIAFVAVLIEIPVAHALPGASGISAVIVGGSVGWIGITLTRDWWLQ